MEKTDNDNLPKHIAIIMDGNRRWAKKRNLPTNLGHKEGAKVLEVIAKYCANIGIKVLTVYAFSSENWKRSKEEVDGLMNLFEQYIHEFDTKYQKENIKIRFLGDRTKLSNNLIEGMNRVETATNDNTGMIFNIAFNYGSKDEIINAVKNMVNDNVTITKENLDNYLYTNESGNVDLLIRTSGEQRISNFLLWQIAYAEFYFTDVHWPDFKEKELEKALENYQNRDRRFGGLKDEK